MHALFAIYNSRKVNSKFHEEIKSKSWDKYLREKNKKKEEKLKTKRKMLNF